MSISFGLEKEHEKRGAGDDHESEMGRIGLGQILKGLVSWRGSAQLPWLETIFQWNELKLTCRVAVGIK